MSFCHCSLAFRFNGQLAMQQYTHTRLTQSQICIWNKLWKIKLCISACHRCHHDHNYNTLVSYVAVGGWSCLWGKYYLFFRSFFSSYVSITNQRRASKSASTKLIWDLNLVAIAMTPVILCFFSTVSQLFINAVFIVSIFFPMCVCVCVCEAVILYDKIPLSS